MTFVDNQDDVAITADNMAFTLCHHIFEYHNKTAAIG